MANSPFDPMQEDEELDQQALMAQLAEKPAAPSDAPTSNAMPVGGGASVTPAATGFDAQRVTSRGGAPPAGFDAKNWADDDMQSVKYRAGRLLQGINKPSEMAARVQSEEFQRAFPGATFDGKDRINFQGALSDGQSGVPVFDIDVLQQADAGADSSNGFWWGHDVPGMNQGPSAPQSAATRAAGPSAPAPMAIDGPQTAQPGGTDADPMDAIMKEIEALQNGDTTPMDQQALMQMLGLQ